MSLRHKAFSLLLTALVCLLGPQSSQAGVIPWVYDAIFGYHGPAFGGGMPAYGGYGGGFGGGYGGGGGCLGGGCLGGCLFGGCLGRGLGYPMAGYGYPAGGYNAGYYPSYGVYSPSYAPSYYSAPAMSSCSDCSGTLSLNYAPVSNCDPCGGISTYSSSGCSSCGSGAVQYSPPADSGTGTPTPAEKTPPTDGFKGVKPADNDEIVTPSGGDVGPWSTPIQPQNPIGDPPINPQQFDLKKYPVPEESQVTPAKIEPKVASTIEPIRRRTAFVAGYGLPSVVRVAVAPSPRSTPAANVASK